MLLDGEALEEFKRRYEVVFNTRLSDAQARELEADLRHLYRIVRRRSAVGGDTPSAPNPPWLESRLQGSRDKVIEDEAEPR